MRTHAMETNEPTNPLVGEDVNGTHVISSALDTPVLTPKIAHVGPTSQMGIVENRIPNQECRKIPTSVIETRLPLTPSVQILPFPPSPSSSSSSSPSSSSSSQIFIPRSSQNLALMPISNHIVPQMQIIQKPIPEAQPHTTVASINNNHVFVQNTIQSNHHQNLQPQVQLIPKTLPNQLIPQDQVTILTNVGYLSRQPAVSQPTNSVIQANLRPSVPITMNGTKERVPVPHSHPHPESTEPNKAMKVDPPPEPDKNHTQTNPVKVENAEDKNCTKQTNGDASDDEMEIMSLDLTSRVNIGDASNSEEQRERRMSWEGGLASNEIQENGDQEEQMRVEDEEPMSPMSPMSACSDTEADPLPTQVKSEEAQDDHSSPAFTSHSLPQTDSPVPARSDSGCELHLGPYTPSQSPLLPRIHPHAHSPTHLYSPTQSPGQGRHISGFSSPYSHSPSTGLSRNNSDASQYGGSYNSYSSAPSPISPTRFSPSQSPNLGRVIGHHPGSGGHGVYGGPLDLREPHSLGLHSECQKDEDRLAADLAQHSVLAAQSGITRQQLINSPCPICGDKISGFHYGIFSCESCKGFFKRTVQNKKNYVCMRGSSCPVSITTRKKCPACRFEKCLNRGMKLEAIREDRTRGGRSTYQCTPYTLPPTLVSPSSSGISLDQARISDAASVKSEPQEGDDIKPSSSREKPPVPLLLQQIHDVEHLWHCTEDEQSQFRQENAESAETMAREAMESDSSDCVNNMCKMADGRLYKIVKWCKSLPLFRHILVDDQIILLMNSWCELLLLSCCFRSIDSPGEIRVSSGRTMTQNQAEAMGIGPCVERMLNLAYQLRRLQVDRYEYMAMKAIVLLTSDVAGLKEGEKVRYSQEKVVQALQEYTLSHYPHLPSKFGELLLRIPELQRTCHASKEMLSVKKKEGDVPSFNFLFELLRGDH